METTTLGTLQNVLPIGYPGAGGKPQQSFEFHPWRMDQEDRIAALHQQHANEDSLGVIVADVMGVMLKSIGDKALDNADPAKKTDYADIRLMIGQMYMQDVLYAYLRLRATEIGQYISINIGCPYCKKKHDKIRGDLHTVEVRRYVYRSKDKKAELDTYPPTLNLKLEGGIYIGDAAYTDIEVAPSKWIAIESMTAEELANSAILQKALWRGSIVGVKGHDTKGAPFSANDDMFKTMTKGDMLKIAAAIDEVNAGPDMQVEVECTRCFKPFSSGITWAHEHFFGKSSLYVEETS